VGPLAFDVFPSSYPLLGVGLIRFPHAWDDPRTWCLCPQACGYLSANTTLIATPLKPQKAELHPLPCHCDWHERIRVPAVVDGIPWGPTKKEGQGLCRVHLACPRCFHPAGPQLRVDKGPRPTPWQWPRARSVQHEGRSRLGRGILHATGGLSRGRVRVLRAPPACDYRSALATPDGVCACLFWSLL